MAFVRSAGKGFFPLDKELELLPGILTPHGHECLVRLASWMPFEEAAKLFEEFMTIRVSKSLSERYTEEAGAVYVDLQTEEMECLERDMPVAPAGADKRTWMMTCVAMISGTRKAGSMLQGSRHQA